MPARLSDRALTFLADMPPYYESDPYAQAIITGGANELGRIEDYATDFRRRLFPINADEETLPLWEAFLGLPVNPVDANVDQRRGKVLAFLSTITSGAGLDWEANMTRALGSTSWSYQEGPGSYQVTLSVPYQPGSYTSAAVAQLAALITPAHLQITVVYSQGFILGVSLLGMENL